MASFNKVILIGNMTADPEMKVTPGGNNVTSFSIGVRRQGKDDTSDFFNIVAWNKTAEFVCKYFAKGSGILICGRLQTRSWTDQNGQKRTVTEVVADEVSFIDRKQTAAPAQNNAPSVPYGKASEHFEEQTPDDDLPF